MASHLVIAAVINDAAAAAADDDEATKKGNTRCVPVMQFVRHCSLNDVA